MAFSRRLSGSQTDGWRYRYREYHLADLSDDGTDERRRRELAGFLRSRRDRLTPAAVGLPATVRRRARGLLREEVAQRAGMSVTWYTWMEQARPINPSQEALRRLADALLLEPAEADHLVRLCRPDLAVEASGGAALSEAHQRMLRGLAPHPAYALDADWTVLDWNPPAERLLGGFVAPCGSRNLLRLLFTDPRWRRLFAQWDTVAGSAVAQFRAASADRLGQVSVQDLVAGLRRDSPPFDRAWGGRGGLPPPGWGKALDHPTLGRLTFEFMTVQPDGAVPGIRFSLYVPADEATRRTIAG